MSLIISGYPTDRVDSALLTDVKARNARGREQPYDLTDGNGHTCG